MNAMEYLVDQERADKRYWLTPAEACQLLCCGKTTLWKLWKAGLVESRLDNGRRKYVRASVYAYIAERVRKDSVVVVKVVRPKRKSKSRWSM
jgi:hypothetical protein